MNEIRKSTEIFKKKAPIRFYSRKELCALYKISSSIFSSSIAHLRDEIGKKGTKMFNPRQVRLIFEELGDPDE